MNEADQVFPTEDEVPVVAPKKVDQVAAQPQPQNTVAADTGIAAIQQIANMIQSQNIGTDALEEGAAIARSAA